MTSEPVLESELLDVTGVDLARLAELPDTALRAALHRILAENAELPNRFAAFESSL
ncbi:FxSxx-COOH cyclophane-containing RiPP peptide [Saccharothrix sp. NRRL B-16348]|uniref:FxSxx-COOH cyclophane-containing RiPP peptide n=1 Tax=Saccharothrix sp. NRRL B-16348 TaxID=1415542 RepID=UPI0007C80976|nr:FxSxx-COOH cyclophane-containing RiPP peptide [Saccharothrix sp. NRRL B-16348]